MGGCSELPLLSPRQAHGSIIQPFGDRKRVSKTRRRRPRLIGLPNGKIPLLVLAGPTAVGKSACALKLAPRVRGEVVSADSAQVYRYLNIGTAKPGPEER